MKNIKNKLLMVGLSSLTAAPLLASCAPVNVISANTYSSNELYLPDNGDTGSQGEACTVSYIGKKCTPNNQAIIARATDCSPKAVHLKLKHFARDEIANKTIVGKLGLKYPMPAHTYAYTSCPLSDKTSDDPVWATGMWENNAINEMGVGNSATLTCSTNPKVLELEDELFIKAGVGEELLPTIMGAQAATAKEAMQIAAKAIDDYGAQDANIIMSVDQNEAWLMEIYSKHQYCAVKLPDDKVFIAGNEFILDSLNDLGINESNKDELCITSAGLYDKVKDTDFVKYRGDTKDIYHLDLFNTYAREGTGANDGVNKFRDTCHMRTWRGYSLFDKSYTGLYSQTTKYEPFLTPKDENGKVRTDMTAADIFEVYRDEFDELTDEDSSKKQQIFVDQKKNGTLRPIAVQTTRQVHIMSSDPTKPKWIAANEWYTPSSGNYTPFLQFNNAVTSFDGDYGYYPDRFIMDENCSSVLFRELNKLAWYDRKHYGFPLQEFWRPFEYIYCQQMQQVTDEASKLGSVSDAMDIVTNFNKHVRDEYIKQVKQTTKDLMWHIMDQPASPVQKQIFVPLIDLENYVKELGWTNYKFDGTTVTFEKDNVKCKYVISDGVIYAKGKLTVNDGEDIELRDNVINNKVYVDLAELNNAISQYSEIRTINISDYLSKKSELPIVLFCSIGIPVITSTAIIVPICITFKRKKAKPIA